MGLLARMHPIVPLEKPRLREALTAREAMVRVLTPPVPPPVLPPWDGGLSILPWPPAAPARARELAAPLRDASD